MASEVKLPYAGTAADSVKAIPLSSRDTFGIKVNPTLNANDDRCVAEAERYCTTAPHKLGVNVATGRGRRTRFTGGF